MQATIYIKNGDLATYRLFQKVCDREEKSVSEKLMKMIYDYVAVHGAGNPQTILDYAGEIKTLPKWKTCKNSNKIRVQGSVFCNPHKRGYPPYWRSTEACKRCENYEPTKG